MQLKLTNAGKRYNREWIFRHLDYEFVPGKKYAITGPNGSGKSTLLQIIGGAIQLNEGTIQYAVNSVPFPSEKIYQQVSIAAPYLELIEEMTTKEFLAFHAQFKPLSLPLEDIMRVIGLEKAVHKQIRYFSSGMKQRLKLGQAFFCNNALLLLDEPTANLDADGILLYQQLINSHIAGKLVIVSSNDPHEYGFCEEIIHIGDHKNFT